MAKANRRLLVALAVVVAISAVLLGFDAALIGAIALGICVVILGGQFITKLLLKPRDESDQGDPFDESAKIGPSTEDQEIYNPKDPAIRSYWEAP